MNFNELSILRTFGSVQSHTKLASQPYQPKDIKMIIYFLSNKLLLPKHRTPDRTHPLENEKQYNPYFCNISLQI